MKRPHRVLRLQKWLLALCSSTLAFLVGCSNIIGQNVAAYGMPHASFKARGTIKAANTGEPIEGIEITISELDDYPETDTTFSDESGEYRCSTTIFSHEDSLKLSFRDVDGAENGLFIPKDTVIHYRKSELTGASGDWYLGEISKEINITLEEFDENSN